ncbi:MAG: hypothetical protein AB1752_09225 [Candidatus Zixiibacteriota bacterium]
MTSTPPIDGNTRFPVDKPAANSASREMQQQLMLAKLFGQKPATSAARPGVPTPPAVDDNAPHLGRYLDVTA